MIGTLLCTFYQSLDLGATLPHFTTSSSSFIFILLPSFHLCSPVHPQDNLSSPCVQFSLDSVLLDHRHPHQYHHLIMSAALECHHLRPRRFTPLKPARGTANAPPLKGIVFDVDGTLWYVHQRPPRFRFCHCMRLFSVLGIRLFDSNKFGRGGSRKSPPTAVHSPALFLFLFYCTIHMETNP